MTPPSRQPRQDRPSPAPDAPGVCPDAARTTQSASGTSQGKDQVERLADAVAAAVQGCSAVARLVAGPVATYLPGRLVRGVAVRGGEVRVAVVARYGPPLPRVAADVRAAVRQVDPGLRVEVMIEDIDLRASGTRP
jgi:uncharacterized alkaline shock family protein YloU